MSSTKWIPREEYLSKILSKRKFQDDDFSEAYDLKAKIKDQKRYAKIAEKSSRLRLEKRKEREIITNGGFKKIKIIDGVYKLQTVLPQRLIEFGFVALPGESLVTLEPLLENDCCNVLVKTLECLDTIDKTILALDKPVDTIDVTK